MTTVWDSLSDLQRSALRELVNIGVGHAATALSTMIGHPIHMSVPTVVACGLESLPEQFVEGPEALSVAVHMPIESEIGGAATFVFPWSGAQSIWRTLIGRDVQGVEDIDELAGSVLLEIGNILIGNYLNAIASFTNTEMHATPTAASVDSAAAILGSIAVEAELTNSEALLIETNLSADDWAWGGHFLFIPGEDGLNRLLEGLGLGEVA